MKIPRYLLVATAAMLALSCMQTVQAYPYGGGWGGYRGGYGYYGGYRGCYGGGWYGTGIPNGLGWTMFGLGAAALAAPVAYAAAAPVYSVPVYPSMGYYQPSQAVVVEQPAPPVRREPTAPPNATLEKAQSKLAGLGYYKGPVDGSFGPATAQAVQQFQADNNLPVSGRLDLKTLSDLGISL